VHAPLEQTWPPPQSESPLQPGSGGITQSPPSHHSPPPQSESLVQPEVGGATHEPPSHQSPPQSESEVQPELGGATQAPPWQSSPPVQSESQLQPEPSSMGTPVWQLPSAQGSVHAPAEQTPLSHSLSQRHSSPKGGATQLPAS
jgi:hypothetical protein